MENFDITRIDGHALKVFLHVLQSGSVTKTAHHFSINQSTASHTLEKLRHAVGQVLFVRSGRGIAPTSAAIELAPYAREIVERLDALTQLETFQPETDKRPFTIVANVTELLPELLRISEQLGQFAPNARIRLLELGSRDNLEFTLDEGLADVAVSVHSPTLSPFLSTENVITDPLRIFYNPEYRGPVETIEDYFAADHVVLDFGGKRKSTVSEQLGGKNTERNITMGVANVYAMAGVLKGTGTICTMQSRLGNSIFKGMATSIPPFDLNDVKFDLIWHKRYQNDPRNTWLRELITTTMANFKS